MKVIVFGPPCSGKTTLSALLAQHLGVAHISFQKLCTEQLKIRSKIGEKWKYYMDSKTPFDENLANEIAFGALSSHNSFVIEGYPKRSYEIDFFCKSSGNPDLLVVLSAHEDLLVLRSQKRRVCNDCESTFSIDLLGGGCPLCGKLGQIRSGDDLESFEKRLIEYRMQENEAMPQLQRVALQCMRFLTDSIFPQEVLDSIKENIS